MTRDRVTFVIEADNRGDVLVRVVVLLHRLNVQVAALNMVRRDRSETMRMYVTIFANLEACGRIEASLDKLVPVRSVKTEGAREILRDSPGDDT